MSEGSEAAQADTKSRNKFNHKIPVEGEGYKASASVSATSLDGLAKAIDQVTERLNALKVVHGI